MHSPGASSLHPPSARRRPGSGQERFLLLLCASGGVPHCPGIPVLRAQVRAPPCSLAPLKHPVLPIAVGCAAKRRPLLSVGGCRTTAPAPERLLSASSQGAAALTQQRTALPCNAVLSWRDLRCSAAPRMCWGRPGLAGSHRDGADPTSQLHAGGCHHMEAGCAAKPWDSAAATHGVGWAVVVLARGAQPGLGGKSRGWCQCYGQG